MILWRLPLFLPAGFLIPMLLALLFPAQLAAATVSSAHFVVRVPDEGEASSLAFAEALSERLEVARAQVLEVFPGADGEKKLGSIDVVVAESTDAFMRRSGRGGYQAAAIVGSRLYLQPVGLLSSYQDLDATLRHELAHPLVEAVTGRGAPRWLVEGVVMSIAQEKPPGYPAESDIPLSLAGLARVEAFFAGQWGREQTCHAYRMAYYAAGRLILRAQEEPGKGLQALLEILPKLKQGVPVEALIVGGMPIDEALKPPSSPKP